MILGLGAADSSSPAGGAGMHDHTEGGILCDIEIARKIDSYIKGQILFFKKYITAPKR